MGNPGLTILFINDLLKAETGGKIEYTEILLHFSIGCLSRFTDFLFVHLVCAQVEQNTPFRFEL